MNQEIHLTALREDNPRDFLAALGLLRLADHIWKDTPPTLAWSQVSGKPTLIAASHVSGDWGKDILKLLQGWQSAECNLFSHHKIEGISTHDFRNLLVTESPRTEIHASFYSGLASQIAHEKSGRRSELIIESANRSVLKGVNDLLSSTRNPPDITADFTGNGSLQVVSNTSRWHPAEYQAAAYASADPTDNKHRDYISLNILALFGLTFLPVVDIAGKRITSGIRRVGRVTEFSWPVWEKPLSVPEISTLILHPSIHSAGSGPSQLSSLGIHRIWRSRKFSPDGKNDYFSSAKPSF